MKFIEDPFILILIIILSLVQSVFGMGILVFGTPIMLLIGYEFVPTIQTLLPASITISTIQVLRSEANRPQISKNLYFLCLPGIGIGLYISASGYFNDVLKPTIGIVLIFSALLRYWQRSYNFMKNLLKSYSRVYHLLMGLLHGITNLGGAMLSILAVQQHFHKQSIHYTISHYYLFFGSMQITTLFITGNGNGVLNNIFYAVPAAIVYIFAGNRLYGIASNEIYNNLMTLFILAYGIAILINTAYL